MAVWKRMPAARRHLAEAGEYTPEHVSEVMNRWAKSGHVLSVRGQWTHRQPRT
jgi:CRP-like cAMP-binding protein